MPLRLQRDRVGWSWSGCPNLARGPFWLALLLGSWLSHPRCIQAQPSDLATKRLNVVLVAVDDLRPDLGCYGVPHAQSLHFDTFARSALRFSRHYVQVATCGASRYAMLTGRSPARSGVTAANDPFYAGESAISSERLEAAQTMPELFRRNGYRTSMVGKVSHTPDGYVFHYDGSGDGRVEVPHAWDEMMTPVGKWQRGWGSFFAYPGGVHREDGAGHRGLMEFTAASDEDLPDGQIADAATRQLATLSSQDQPFFLAVGFYKPHLPLVAPRLDWDAFEGVIFPLPRPWRVDSRYWHQSNEFYKYDMPFEKSFPLSPESQQTALRAYSACVRYVDRQLGRILIAIDELGLRDNTVVVVWSDHGWHLGEQQMWGKHTPFERACRSVLMIRVPGMTTGGKSSDALVETLDLYPTLVEICQLPQQETAFPLDGKSLVPIVRHERAVVRSHAISYWKDAVSIRSNTHRLVTQLRDGVPVRSELYDLSNDLDSVNDLAGARPDIVVRMRKLLE